jgi:hypothetical protein
MCLATIYLARRLVPALLLSVGLCWTVLVAPSHEDGGQREFSLADAYASGSKKSSSSPLFVQQLDQTQQARHLPPSLMYSRPISYDQDESVLEPAALYREHHHQRDKRQEGAADDEHDGADDRPGHHHHRHHYQADDSEYSNAKDYPYERADASDQDHWLHHQDGHQDFGGGAGGSSPSSSPSALDESALSKDDNSNVLLNGSVDGGGHRSRLTDAEYEQNNSPDRILLTRKFIEQTCNQNRGFQRNEQLNSTYLAHCSRYKLENLLSNDILDAIMHDDTGGCHKILDEFVQLDETINQFDDLFIKLLSRYNCHNGYSVKWNCDDCKVSCWAGGASGGPAERGGVVTNMSPGGCDGDDDHGDALARAPPHHAPPAALISQAAAATVIRAPRAQGVHWQPARAPPSLGCARRVGRAAAAALRAAIMDAIIWACRLFA